MAMSVLPMTPAAVAPPTDEVAPASSSPSDLRADAGTAVEQLARVSLAAQAHPQSLQRAAWHLLDWLGCAAIGSTLPQGQVYARWLALQSPGSCPTLAGRHSDPAAAAAYHGALGSLLEMDDVHRSSILHPGPVVIPAALAAAPPGASGADLLRALVAGYEVMIRVGRALGPSHYRHWHTTATAGVFGAAAAAASLLKLSAAQTAQALALAGTRGGGLWQVRHESQGGKSWHMAGAARDGLAAAQLAAVGLTGPLGVIDGASGWVAATAPTADLSLIWQPRDEPWINDVSFKPWPACRHAHPAIDALMTALGPQPLAPDEVLSVSVHTYADALRFCDRPMPQDEAQARFSIQHALAAVLLWGPPQLPHYLQAAVNDVRARRLRARVSVAEDAVLQAGYPASYGARVVVQASGGRQWEAALTDTLGDPARPLSAQARQDKARGLMQAAGWNEARVHSALAACLDLPQAENLQALSAVLADQGDRAA